MASNNVLVGKRDEGLILMVVGKAFHISMMYTTSKNFKDINS